MARPSVIEVMRRVPSRMRFTCTMRSIDSPICRTI
jgi:hypothetical protein